MSNLCASMSPLSQTSSVEMKKNYVKTGLDFYDNLEHKTRNSEDKKKSTSFIQQRVERLYGAGALAHGFYSPKKIKASFVNKSAKCNNTFPPSGDYDTLNKNDMVTIESVKNKATEKCEKNMNELPVLRHVSEEFRAQLPLISFNRNQIRKMEKQYSDHINDQEKIPHLESSSVKDEVDHDTTKINNIGYTEIVKGDMSTETLLSVTNVMKREENSTIEKELDGEYFLKILRTEQSRLLTLAERAEKYIELLLNNTGVSEDIFGILRSASGKARLLVTQKMKQFEGLCYKNIHKPLDDTFPTTVDDLQGFWDMVYLQVSNINETFDEIEILRKNNWKKTNVESSAKGIQQISLKDKKSKAKSLPNRNISKINSEMSVAKMKREAQRKQLMEFKRKHKMTLAGNSVIIPADDVKSKPNVSDAFIIDNSS